MNMMQPQQCYKYKFKTKTMKLIVDKKNQLLIASPYKIINIVVLAHIYNLPL